MKTPSVVLLLFLLIFIALSCAENPTEIKNSTPVNSDLYDLYLRKLEAKPLNITFEEFKEHRLSRTNRVMKSGNNVVTDADFDWESDYGENLDLVDESYVDLSDPGDVVNVLPSDFTFKFFGVDYNTIYVHSNGYITFREVRTFADILLPTVTEVPIIAALAADFDPSYDGMVAYKNMIGTAPNRIVIITWVDIPEYFAYDPNTFQIKLFEGSNKIQFGYNGISVQGYDLGPDGVTPDTDYPQEAGISANADQVYIAAEKEAIPALDGTNICFTPTCASALEYEVSYVACTDINTPPPPCPDSNPVTLAEKLDKSKIALENLLAGNGIEKKLKKATEKAIQEIEKSLDEDKWLDENNLHPKSGNKVFDDLKKAAKELKKFEKAKGASLDQKLAVEEVIDTLISVCRNFAETALAKLDCTTGKCGKEREKALKELFKAEEEYAKRHWDHTIDSLKKVWEHAQKAIEHVA